jgi:hypothetical protein
MAKAVHKSAKSSKTISRKKISEYITIITHLIVKIKGNFKCIRCGKQFKMGDKAITASHFWKSTQWKTKWVFDNIDCICYGCHIHVFERNKQGHYRTFKLNQLGQERYDELEKMAYTVAKWTDFELHDILRLYLKKLLDFKREDVKYENGDLSIFINGKWKKKFHYEIEV